MRDFSADYTLHYFACNNCANLFIVSLDLCRVDSVGLSVGLHRNYKLPNQQGYISATGGRLVFADSEFEVGWGESMYHVLTGMCSNYQVVIVTVLAH